MTKWKLTSDTLDFKEKGSKMRGFYAGVFVLVVGFNFASAQHPGWENYTSGKEVTSIVSEGNKLWIGTTGGLVCMDTTTGNMTFYNHANSGLPDNWVNTLAIEGTTKWVGTYGGVAKFDGTTWTVYNTGNSGLPYNYVSALAMEGTTKWVGTREGLASYREQGVEEKSKIKNGNSSKSCY